MEDVALHQLLKLPSETREDRTKRLFRHYTVGSYDSLTSHRYKWGPVGRRARVGMHADGISDVEGEPKLAEKAWG